MRIGVFGGSFNPIHHGHLILAQDVMEACDLDEVQFVPCGAPNHKDKHELAPAEHRMAMVDLVTESDFRFSSSDREIRRDRTSYTVETLEELQVENPDDEFCFLVGTDSFPELSDWHRIHDLLARFTVIGLVRPGFGIEALEEIDFGLEAGLKERLLKQVVRGHAVGISATDIRARVAEGMAIRYLVPVEVEMYIAEHGLYRG